jgi:retron-type reverse transcriptase
MYKKIYDIENLYLASHNALKGKKSKSSAARFWLYEDREILQMQKELKEKSYTFGSYNSFILHDNGVDRRISVAPFRDRVLHHAIMQQIEPLFEKSFIYDSYANRKGKGTLNALKRARYYANKYRYVLQLDIQKFFPSIDHEILFLLLSKKIECKETKTLLKKLIDNSNRQDDAFFYYGGDTLFTPYERKKGIPLGNLTSQFFGNLYLNPFDHFVKERLGVKGYIRYVDDTLYFSNSKSFLTSIIEKIKEFLANFRLKIHPLKIKLIDTTKGFIFLGHKVFKSHFRLTSKAIRRGRKKLRKISHDYRYDRVNLTQAKNSIFGTIGFFKMGNNAKIIDELLAQTVLSKKPYLEVVPSGRFVEQQC